MKCPVMFLARHISEREGRPLDYYCLKEKCAWWDNTNGNCAILQLSKSIYYMGLELAQAVKKMPHEGQFRK